MVRALGRGIFNAVGLFLLIAFLGYGFVEVPRHLLNMANTEGQLRYAAHTDYDGCDATLAPCCLTPSHNANLMQKRLQ